MPATHRLNDPNTGGGTVCSIPQSTVFTNSLLTSVDGSLATSHGPCPLVSIHCKGNYTTANGSNNVFINCIPVNFQGNGDTCGDSRDSGSSNVFING